MLNRKTLTASLTALAIGGFAATSQADVFVDFNEASDLADFDSTTNYSFGATTGVGGSGGLNVNGNGTVAQYTPETFDLNAGESLTVSQEGFFDAQSRTATGTGTPFIRVGLTDTPSTGFGSGNFVQGSILSSNDASGTFLQVQAGEDSPFTTGSPVVLTDDTWYRLVVDFLGTGGNDVQITANLFNIGSDGTSAATLVPGGTLTDTFTAPNIIADPTLFAGFKTDATSGGEVLDNFSVVIPEPASLALLGLGGLCLMGRRKR